MEIYYIADDSCRRFNKVQEKYTAIDACLAKDGQLTIIYGRDTPDSR